MLMPRPFDNKTLEFILDIINQYNAEAEPLSNIQYVYVGSSAELAWIGKTVQVYRPNESEIVTIPHAIIPFNQLRKRYGISPLLGKHRTLTGAKADKKGIQACLELISHITAQQLMRLDKLIFETIFGINQNNYLRSLKKLVALCTNMMLFDEKAKEKSYTFLDALQYEFQNLEKQLYKNPDQLSQLHYDFNHYLARIENVLSGKSLPFQPDSKFRNEILTSFPILYCSTSTPSHQKKDPASIIQFEKIKIIFSSQQNLPALELKLKEIGLSDVRVYGYETRRLSDFSVSLSDNEIAVMRAHTLKEITSICDKSEKCLSSNKILIYKFTNCLNRLFINYDDQSYPIAAWIIENASNKLLTEIKLKFNKSINFKKCKRLYEKYIYNKYYLQHIKTYYNEYYSSFSAMRSLEGLILLKDKIQENRLFNFSDHFNNNMMLSMLESNLEKVNKQNYLLEYLMRLQNYYNILMKELEYCGTLEQAAFLQSRIASIKGKYIVLMNEYIRHGPLYEDLYGSELFRNLENAFTRSWQKITISQKKYA